MNKRLVFLLAVLGAVGIWTLMDRRQTENPAQRTRNESTPSTLDANSTFQGNRVANLPNEVLDPLFEGSLFSREPQQDGPAHSVTPPVEVPPASYQSETRDTFEMLPKLVGVILAPNGGSAYFEGEFGIKLLFVDDVIEKWTLKAVSADGVLIEKNGQMVDLRLELEN